MYCIYIYIDMGCKPPNYYLGTTKGSAMTSSTEKRVSGGTVPGLSTNHREKDIYAVCLCAKDGLA